MGITAPSQEAQAATRVRLLSARSVAKPLSRTEVEVMEETWTRDGMHHHMGATSIIHRLLATIATMHS